MSKVDVYMRLYIADWDADTADLSLAEEALYFRLVRHLWKRGGSLEMDEVRLARMCRVSAKQWAKVWPRIERFFSAPFGRPKGEPQTIIQKRVMEELQKARDAHDKRASAGKKGAKAKWGDAAQDGNAIGNAVALLEQSHPSVIRHPSTSLPAEEKEESPSDSCAETPPASSPPPMASPSLLQFPTDGKTQSWDLTEAHVSRLREAFPHIDVEAEARKARAWLDANPGRRKTAKGMPKFLYGWVERAQNSGRVANDLDRRAPGSGRRATDAPLLNRTNQATADALARFVNRHTGGGGS